MERVEGENDVYAGVGGEDEGVSDTWKAGDFAEEDASCCSIFPFSLVLS
jgi:hypothetical protein